MSRFDLTISGVLVVLILWSAYLAGKEKGTKTGIEEGKKKGMAAAAQEEHKKKLAEIKYTDNYGKIREKELATLAGKLNAKPKPKNSLLQRPLFEVPNSLLAWLALGGLIFFIVAVMR